MFHGVVPRRRASTPTPIGVTDYKAVGDIYRSRFGGPWFPVTRVHTLKPLKCDTCNWERDEFGNTSGQCNGMCGCD